MEFFGVLLVVSVLVLSTIIVYTIITGFINYFVEDTTLIIDDEIINEITIGFFF